MRLLQSPTRIVWLIGRTQTHGTADYPLVHRLQDGVTLQRWADGATGSVTHRVTHGAAAQPAWQASAEPTRPPFEQVQALSTEAFFTRLAALMVDNPAAAADGPMLARLSSLGITPGQPLRWSLLDRWCVSLGRWVADFKLARELKKPRQGVRGWSTPPRNLGQYGIDYATRAGVAMVGLGANLAADALYPNAQVDGQGEPLDGSRRYRLHFKAGELPPVKAFWSVTAYGADDYLIANPMQRYALGDRDPAGVQRRWVTGSVDTGGRARCGQEEQLAAGQGRRALPAQRTPVLARGRRTRRTLGHAGRRAAPLTAACQRQHPFQNPPSDESACKPRPFR